MVEAYMKAGAIEKGKALADRMREELMKSISFYIGYYDVAKDEFELCCNCLYYLADTIKRYGDEAAAAEIIKSLEATVKGSAI